MISPVIEAGKTFGPYQILEPIGAGGMGEVYKARDTRLDRIVAIKVLPAHLSEQPDSRERLEREARAISGLNHPHICTLHDIGRQDEIDFLVMEYLEGETLAARLMKGALPIDQAVKFAIQIADALDKAHRQGVIHRDLKPANVMLTKSGAKLLDFGLAKLTPSKPAVTAVSMLPTVEPSVNLTAQGTILGTLQYMAPEQLEGLEADPRTDIFAFGALMYEMVTGRKAFPGKSQPSLITAIMSAEPPPLSSQSMSPPALDHVVKTCLAKDPADRWQTAHDVMAQLKWISEGGSQLGVPAPVSAARRSRDRLLISMLAASALLLVAMAVPTFLYFQDPPEPNEIRFTVETPFALNPVQLALSPDGRWMAFPARSSTSGVPAIFVRRLDSTSFQQLAGTEGGSSPFWSPDSRHVGFFANARLKKVAVTAGTPQDLTDAAPVGGSWNGQGTILFSRGGNLFSISASGGEPRAVEVDTTPPAAFAQFLPDGNQFLYTAPGPTAGIYVAALDSKNARLLVPGLSSGAYVDPGFVLFQRQGALFAQAFNPKALTLSGEPIQILDEVLTNAVNGRAAFAVSQNGVLLYRGARGVLGNQQFIWYDRSGKQLGPAGKPDAYAANFDLSPDGKQVALSIVDPTGSGPTLWLMDWARGVTTPFTFGGRGAGTDVVWSPDGLRLAYSRSRERESGADIVAKNANGLGEEEVLVANPTPEWVEDWSKDGRYLAYITGSGIGIWAIPQFGDRKPFPIVESPFDKDEPHFSFDSRWLAYNSSESGTSQIYVISFPAKDQKLQVSDTGGTQPRWKRDGTELYYLGLDGRMMAVNIRSGAKLDAGSPRALFETGISVSVSRDQYAVTPDGQRFLLLKPLSDAAQAPLTVVVNWTRLLR